MRLQFQISSFQTHIQNKHLEYFLWNCPRVNATRPHLCLVRTDSGNGLVPSGTKSFPEPMLSKIYITICHHLTIMSQHILLMFNQRIHNWNNLQVEKFQKQSRLIMYMTSADKVKINVRSGISTVQQFSWLNTLRPRENGRHFPAFQHWLR